MPDIRALSHPTSDGRALAAVQEVPKFGLGHMPAVEPTIAFLVISPDEVLREDAGYPRPRCRIMDDFLCRVHDAGAHMGRCSCCPRPIYMGPWVIPLPVVWSGLQTYAFSTKELNRLLLTLVSVHLHAELVWPPLTELS